MAKQQFDPEDFKKVLATTKLDLRNVRIPRRNRALPKPFDGVRLVPFRDGFAPYIRKKSSKKGTTFRWWHLLIGFAGIFAFGVGAGLDHVRAKQGSTPYVLMVVFVSIYPVVFAAMFIAKRSRKLEEARLAESSPGSQDRLPPSAVPATLYIDGSAGTLTWTGWTWVEPGTWCFFGPKGCLMLGVDKFKSKDPAKALTSINGAILPTLFNRSLRLRLRARKVDNFTPLSSTTQRIKDDLAVWSLGPTSALPTIYPENVAPNVRAMQGDLRSVLWMSVSAVGFPVGYWLTAPANDPSRDRVLIASGICVAGVLLCFGLLALLEPLIRRSSAAYVLQFLSKPSQ